MNYELIKKLTGLIPIHFVLTPSSRYYENLIDGKKIEEEKVKEFGRCFRIIVKDEKITNLESIVSIPGANALAFGFSREEDGIKYQAVYPVKIKE